MKSFVQICRLDKDTSPPAGLMRNLHIIHDDIALHKFRPQSYIEFKKTERDRRKRSGPSAARPAASAQDAEKVSEPKGSHHRIRSGALLLPAPLRSDGQHSSSQLPVTINDARWTSSPSGRYLFQNTRKSLYFRDFLHLTRANGEILTIWVPPEWASHAPST
ncbi:hypothetical protein [Pararhizobium polonicum]|uniref:hypothetical protein n=1 Tax=Pararhizobium polonicum TaxID=1612624 RepID=UPI0011129865|nr:hypothetical protein [Pararhizobium polonicum]